MLINMSRIRRLVKSKFAAVCCAHGTDFSPLGFARRIDFSEYCDISTDTHGSHIVYPQALIYFHQGTQMCRTARMIVAHAE